MIDIDGLTRRYGDTTVVDTVTLQVPQGELLALVGGSGAGKTTLLKMINRLIEPTAPSHGASAPRREGRKRPRGRVGSRLPAVGIEPFELSACAAAPS